MAKTKLTDLSGDGKVTRKDVLIGRGVIKKRRGGSMGGGMNPGGYSKDPTIKSITGYNPIKRKKGGPAKRRGGGIAKRGFGIAK